MFSVESGFFWISWMKKGSVILIEKCSESERKNSNGERLHDCNVPKIIEWCWKRGGAGKGGIPHPRFSELATYLPVDFASSIFFSKRWYQIGNTKIDIKRGDSPVFEIDWWNFQQMLDLGFSETSQNLSSFKQLLFFSFHRGDHRKKNQKLMNPLSYLSPYFIFGILFLKIYVFTYILQTFSCILRIYFTGTFSTVFCGNFPW